MGDKEMLKGLQTVRVVSSMLRKACQKLFHVTICLFSISLDKMLQIIHTDGKDMCSLPNWGEYWRNRNMRKKKSWEDEDVEE